MNPITAQIQSQAKADSSPETGILQRKCACGGYTIGGGQCSSCREREQSLQRKAISINGSPTLAIQRKLTIGASDDPLEREADRIADQVMLMPANAAVNRAPIRIQRFTGSSTGAITEAPTSVDRVLSSPGRSLEPELRQDMEQRFGYDFSSVNVHSGSEAEKSAHDVNANAYTAGPHIVFGSGQLVPDTREGRRLIAHELVHVVQQAGANARLSAQNPLSGILPQFVSARLISPIQRQVAAREHPERHMDFRPSLNGQPCACLVFIHNDEHNARTAAESLHRNCRFNLASIGAGRDRRIAFPGTGRGLDPNEFFTPSVQEECQRDERSCREYAQRHDDREAMERRFFLAISDCSNQFGLPTIALHNNDINDTAQTRGYRREHDHRLVSLIGEYMRQPPASASGIFNLENLESRLMSVLGGDPEGEQSLAQLIGIRRESTGPRSGGMTNIFRWCVSPEIGRCYIGNPYGPDHVIWTTNPNDYNRLIGQDWNVVLQAEAGRASERESQSQKDLSTLFVRIGSEPDVPVTRYINIETPMGPDEAPAGDPNTLWNNMAFILQVLSQADLGSCCAWPTETGSGPNG